MRMSVLAVTLLLAFAAPASAQTEEPTPGPSTVHLDPPEYRNGVFPEIVGPLGGVIGAAYERTLAPRVSLMVGVAYFFPQQYRTGGGGAAGGVTDSAWAI